jgi:beta-glucosidase
VPPALSSVAHRQLARAAAAAGITLLKNDGNVLPLDRSKLRTIAVIGPNADVALVQGGGSAQINASDYVTPLDALRDSLRANVGKSKENVSLTYAQGVDNEPFPAVVDRRFLSPTRAREQRGLEATYYPNPDFAGVPVKTVIEDDFGKLALSLGPNVGNVTGMSVRWRGFFWAPVSGEYQLVAGQRRGGTAAGVAVTTAPPAGSVKVTLTFDGQRLIQADTPPDAIQPTGFFATEARSAKVTLVAGQAYPIELEYVNGAGGRDQFRFSVRQPPSSIDEAVRIARMADVALVFVGSSSNSESEGVDRPSLGLYGQQDALVAAVVAANPRTIVVLNNGAPVEMPWVEQVPAIVEAWLPGQEGPRALADVLFGEVNPSGKLPVSFPKRLQDNPSFLYYPGRRDANYGEGLFVGYRYYDKKEIEPLFPFGHGLSYTTFEYSKLRVPEHVGFDGRFEVSVDVRNTGSREGMEVPQFYIQNQHCIEICAIRELKGFGKINLKPGETKTVTVQLEPRALQSYDVYENNWRATPGRYEIAVGSSSRDLRLRANVTLDP